MGLHDRDRTWFLAQIKPNCSKIAQQNLKRQGFTTFFPLQEETTRRHDRFVTTKRPLFPGYIFVAFHIEHGHWRAINSTQGITKLVSFGSSPSSVPSELVAELMLRCDPTGMMQPATEFQPGDQVRLAAGPFTDFVATIEKIEPDQRVWVLMDIMGRRSRVTANQEHLRAV